MRRLSIVLVVAAVACAAQAALASGPLVPAAAQRAIVTRAKAYAYAPTRVAPNTTYRHWSFAATPHPELRIYFGNKTKRRWSFSVTLHTGRCVTSNRKTFHLAVGKVYWGTTKTGQRAWRCVKGSNGKQLRLAAATSLPRTTFAPLTLGAIVASAHRLP